jgi:hypothetical protein
VDHLRRQALVLTLEDDKPTQLLAVHEASKPRASRVPREREACGRTPRDVRKNMFSPRMFSPRSTPPPPPPTPPRGSFFSGITVPVGLV